MEFVALPAREVVGKSEGWHSVRYKVDEIRRTRKIPTIVEPLHWQAGLKGLFKKPAEAQATISGVKKQKTMPGIFISYRREDSIAYAGRLFDWLADRFGEERIFMDIDTMKVGLDFVEQIEKAVQSCHVLIAVIGKNWVNIQDEEGNRRLENSEDFVRVEIQAALERNIPVVPLLVGGADMPKARDLPEPIANLARWHAMKMSDERFRADATRLIEQISEYVTKAEPERPSKPESLPTQIPLPTELELPPPYSPPLPPWEIP